MIAFNDADFFGSPSHAAEVMKTLKNRGAAGRQESTQPRRFRRSSFGACR